MKWRSRVWIWFPVILALAFALMLMGAASEKPHLPVAKTRVRLPDTNSDPTRNDESRGSGNSLDNQGGPDGFGYTFVDNQGGDTATYSWIELSGDAQATWINYWNPSGNHNNACDSVAVPLGFSFPFYAANYTTVTPTTNSHLLFGTCSPTPTTTCLPSTFGPAILPFLYNLNLNNGGYATGTNTVGYRSFAGYIVFEYDSVGYGSAAYSGSSLKFEAILYQDGRIKLQYNHLVYAGSSLPPMPTVGLENTDGSAALQYRCYSDGNTVRPVNDGLAIWFTRNTGLPNAVTNLHGSSNNNPTVTLTWTDPDHDTQGNLLTPDSILIYRNDSQAGSQIAHVAGGVQTITLANQPSGNGVIFCAAAKHGTRTGAAACTAILVGPTGYSNNFDSNNGGLTATSGWHWGPPTNPSGPLARSAANVWAIGLNSDYSALQCDDLDVDLGMPVQADTAALDFWAWYFTESYYDGVSLWMSTDQGGSWQMMHSTTRRYDQVLSNGSCIGGDSAWCGQSGDWVHIVVPIGPFVGTRPIFRFKFGADGQNQYRGFYIDDMVVWGVGPVPNGIPRVPTNLSGTSNGTLTVTLTWTNPDHDTNGNLLTPDSILVYRDNAQLSSQIAHVAGGMQTVTLTNNEVPGPAITYCIRAKHGLYSSSPVWTTFAVGSPYFSDFETDAGGWTAVSFGVWTWGTATNSSAPAPHSGTHMVGTGMNGNVPANQCGTLDLISNQRVISARATVDFWAWWSMNPNYQYDGCNFKVSTDNGTTWTATHPLYPYANQVIWSGNSCVGNDSAWSETSNGQWRHIVIPIGQFFGITPQFRFTFGNFTTSTTYPGFFLDDMTIWGLHPPYASTVSGFVHHAGGANLPISGAQVYLNGSQGDTVLTDASGYYTLPVDMAGSCSVTFHHSTHCDTTVQNVVIQEGVPDTLNMPMHSPNAAVSASSLTFAVHRYSTQQQTFTVTNSGSCPLIFSVHDSVTWLTSSPAADTVAPNQTVTVTVTASPQQMTIGDYSTTMTVTANAPGSPFMIWVDMAVLKAGDGGDNLPTVFALRPSYPNPFNPVTVLPFDVPHTSPVDIVVYNIMGQEVARPVSGVYAAGRYHVRFDGENLPSGLYLVRMKAGEFTALNKVMLLK